MDFLNECSLPVACISLAPQEKALRKAAKKGGSERFGFMDPMGALRCAVALLGAVRYAMLRCAAPCPWVLRPGWPETFALPICSCRCSRPAPLAAPSAACCPHLPSHFFLLSPPLLCVSCPRLPAPHARQVVPRHGAAGRGGGRDCGAVNRRALHAGARCLLGACLQPSSLLARACICAFRVWALAGWACLGPRKARSRSCAFARAHLTAPGADDTQHVPHGGARRGQRHAGHPAPARDPHGAPVLFTCAYLISCCV